MDKIKDDFDEELDLYMYKEVNGEPVKDTKAKEIKKNEEKIEKKKIDTNLKKREIEKDVNEIIKDSEKKIKKNINISKKTKKEKKKTKSWVYTIILVLILLGLVYYNWDNLFSRPITGQVIAVVNGEELTSEEFDEIYSGVVQQYPAVDRNAVLEQTIDKMLLLQEAEEENIKVTDEEVDEIIDNWLEQIKLTFTEEELKEQLEMQGTTLEELTEESRKNYRENLMINKLLNETILKEKEATLPERIKASHILVDTENEANEILEELKTKDFNELAKEKSKDPSAQINNGSLGWFEKGRMVKEFEDAAFDLKINEISQPVETQFGYHIIKLEDKRDEETKLMSDLTNEEKNLVLFELQDTVTEYVEELRNKADIKTYLTEEIEETPEVTGLVTEEVEEEEKIEEIEVGEIKTFRETGDEICKEDNKPVIRLFSTTWCPHCTWIKDTFDNVVKEYVDEGKIIAHHWELDIRDDTLTEEIEDIVPDSETEIYKKYNPSGGIPTFVFGCKYSRIGNGYEREDSLEKEEAEFRAVIEELLK